MGAVLIRKKEKNILDYSNKTAGLIFLFKGLKNGKFNKSDHCLCHPLPCDRLMKEAWMIKGVVIIRRLGDEADNDFPVVIREL